MSSANRLLIVTHVTHFRHEGRIHGYGPYVRELNIWCDLFPEVTIAAPVSDQPPHGDGLALSRDNVTLRPIKSSGGQTLLSKIAQVLLLPWIVTQLCWAMRRADAIHVRCPGNLGLLGVLLAPMFSKNVIAKYAGQWNGFPKEPWSYRLQRFLLRSRWWRGIVTVYGQWPDQPPQVIPFFTSVMTPEQIERAKGIASRKRADDPLSILFVGRLSKEKNVDVLIDAVTELKQRAVDVQCHIVGHGSEETRLADKTARQNLTDSVHFAGGIDFDQVFDFYDRANVLVLVSETEGWPKAIAEAMACGLICVGSDRGLVPWMLSDGRGFVVPPRDVNSLTESLQQIANSPSLRNDTSLRAAEFGQRYSLDTLRDALQELFAKHWALDVGRPQQINGAVQDDAIVKKGVAVP